ncbi:MAG TPA: NrfD/PsrC family molybdoenzyme membrane anchor subunit [Rhizomicrobium sp.]|nr:NrfD/PsrC family molybdoenzyme membrane anchor subunit [Rhizomicrobium sp.]
MREKEGDARWIGEGITSLEDINARIMAAIFAPAHTWRWWVALAFSGSLTLLMIVTVTWLFAHGIGIFGNNTTIVWGFPIANYVWWLGIGHAGTLISALLLLTRQKWRGSLNRFAETMTLFAASMAGLFPIFHLGRPYYLYWIVPYPNVQDVWPQWRSALVWDFWAVGTYITFSALFWYAGLIPDLAMLRERANSRFVRRLYGAFALGWRGSARHWQVHDRLYRYMAALAVPLVVSVHSIVSLDFAASLEPGWSDTIYPPYFVVGALYSGFAMVVVLAAALRWGCSFQPFITVRHFEVIARVLLTASIIMGVSYASEWFWGWYGGERSERHLVIFLFAGPYAPLYYCQLLFNVVVPQALWFTRVRRSIAAVVVISIIINIGMWLERILIVWATLSHDYLPSSWRIFLPTFWDWALLFGSLGAFMFLFLLFVRILPALPAHELRKLWIEENSA